MNINKQPLKLYASPKAVITLFLSLPGDDRVKNIIQRIEKWNDNEVNDYMQKVMKDFGNRHRNIDEIFLEHFNNIEKNYPGDLSHFTDQKKLLTGAFFTKEYSIQSAALFNPSIVAHPYQQGLQPGEQRFIMSLRATGEGHISSIIFQTGIINKDGSVLLDMPADYFTRLKKNENYLYDKKAIIKWSLSIEGFDNNVTDMLPENFDLTEAKNILTYNLKTNQSLIRSTALLEEMLEMNYELESDPGLPINGNVLFPNAKGECMGMEDTRFVKFEDNGQSIYYGTYTAYDGKQIKTQLIETADFKKFKISSLYGAAISDKGMALFPEKVNGKFVMISRQGGEKINIMFSENLYCWENFQLLMEPKYDWELVQLGNCGSPIKTLKGWLLLTHGVGVIRTYVISAILLDLKNPSKIIGRLDKPLIIADETEREGYVPNVVYTCGFIQHNNLLIIPYAVSDSATGFVTIVLEDLLNEFKF
jgi:predicted GH43/DUF377 family glycosyl hydrolase